jgi:hypothetical protein
MRVIIFLVDVGDFCILSASLDLRFPIRSDGYISITETGHYFLSFPLDLFTGQTNN